MTSPPDRPDDGPVGGAGGVTTTPDVVDELADELGLVEPESPLDRLPATGVATASTVGRSRARRNAGLVAQYIVLVLLAAVVLVPVVYTSILALTSNPLVNLRDTRLWYPRDVTWKDRTWFSGGALSVTARSLALLAVVAWLQLRAAGGRLTSLGLVAHPRRLLAAVAGFVALVLLTGPIIGALVDRSSSTPAWFLGAVAIVAATQLVGFADRRRRRLPAAILLAALAGVGLVGATVVAVGANVWSLAWDTGNLGPAMGRSLVATVAITASQVVTSILAAYAFAYLRFPLKGLAFGLFMGTLLLPMEVTLLGNQQTIRELGWIDTNQALVLPFAATALGTFLIRQGFRGVPPEVRDAARLDGYGHFAFLWRFAVPLTRPVIASFTLIAGLGAWNQYLWPRAVIDDDRRETAQIALRGIVDDRPEEANIAIAAALIVAIPVVLLLIAFQRHIIRGLTAGAVKG